MLLRPTQLPPELADQYSSNVTATTTVTAFTLDRGAYCGIVLHGLADQDLKIHVDSGTDFGGSIEYLNTRTFFAKASVGFSFPVDTPAEKIRVRIENPGATGTTSLKIAAYYSTLNGVPVFQHPEVALWENQSLAAGSGWNYSPTLDLSNSMGGQLTFVLTNGATGPTAVPQAYLQVATEDDTDKFGDYCALGSLNSKGELNPFPTTANASTKQSVVIPHSVKFARVKAGQHTGQAVTASAWANLAHY